VEKASCYFCFKTKN